MDDLSLGNVRPFDRPMTAGPNDRFVGRDDMGNKVYETVAGKRYTIRPATQEESKTTRAKVEDWVDEGLPLPSWEQITDTMKAVPGAVYDSAQRSLSGDASLGELMGFAGASGAPGVASRVGTALDPSVVSAMGATHKVPRYPKKEPVAPKIEEPETFDNEGFLQIDESAGYFDFDVADNWEAPPPYATPNADAYFNKPIQFRDPLDEILSEMEIPSKGITGAQLLKELQDNPTVRMAQLRSQGILDRIDPAKRYGPVDQVRPLLLEGKYEVQAVPQNKYDSYQRQPVADKELNYVEYAINADTDGPTFKANSQHYQPNTLAHVRLSERENASGNYVLIEELQSDLLQKGYVKPSGTRRQMFERLLNESADDERYGLFDGDFDKAMISDVLSPDDLEIFENTEVPNYNERVDTLLADVLRRADANNVITGEGLSDFVEENLDSQLTSDRLRLVEDVIQTVSSSISGYDQTRLPPIAKMEESVRLGLETAIAHAAQNGIERVVLPPFHRIVEQRFTKGSAEYDKAMDPKSGFYQTYVGAVNKVTKKLQEEMGADVEIREFDLQYSAAEGYESAELLYRLNNRETAILQRGLEKIGLEKRLLEELAPEQANLLTTFERSVQEIAPDFTIWDWADRLFSGDRYNSLSQTLQSFFPAGEASVAPALEINFPNAIKNNYDLTRPRFAEGGVVENINPVPPGATPKEVADDVPIMASEGEYIIPANVVRFLGLDKIEKMVEQAKVKLAELDQKGRIGGDTGQEEELPFNPEELQRVPAEDAEIPGMAEGGMVSDPNQQIDPATGLPLWLVQMQQGQSQPAAAPTVTAPPVASPVAPQGPSMRRESDRDRGFEVNLTGTAQSVAKWSPEDFNKYASTRGNTGQALGSAAASMMVPFGGIATRMRGNYLERAVPRGFETMLENGTDLQGNPLTADQITELRTSYDRVKNTAKPRTGAVGALRGLAEDAGIVRRREAGAQTEPRRLRDVFSGGSSRPSSPKASGDGLVSRPEKKKESGGRKTSTNSTNGKTSSKKKT